MKKSECIASEEIKQSQYPEQSGDGSPAFATVLKIIIASKIWPSSVKFS